MQPRGGPGVAPVRADVDAVVGRGGGHQRVQRSEGDLPDLPAPQPRKAPRRRPSGGADRPGERTDEEERSGGSGHQGCREPVGPQPVAWGVQVPDGGDDPNSIQGAGETDVAQGASPPGPAATTVEPGQDNSDHGAAYQPVAIRSVSIRSRTSPANVDNWSRPVVQSPGDHRRASAASSPSALAPVMKGRAMAAEMAEQPAVLERLVERRAAIAAEVRQVVPRR